jgi:flagellar motor switch protein FliN/FliY
MMGQEEVDLNEAALSAIEEAANTLAGSAATTYGEKSGKSAMTSPGETKSIQRDELSFPENMVVKLSYQAKINGKDPSEFVEVFSIELVKSIVGSADQPSSDGFDSIAGLGLGDMGGGQQPMSQSGGGAGGMGQQGMNMFGSGQPTPNVQSLEFPSLNPQSGGAEQGNIGLLMDVYMEMTVELGRTKKLIKEILGMGEGTIIELDKLAGEPVDILVNHKLIAKGEVVVIDENFGVRVTEIVSPMDRVDSLG